MKAFSCIVLVVDKDIEELVRSEIALANLPAYLRISVHTMPLSNAPEQLKSKKALVEQKTNHVFGDAVFFISQRMATLAGNYLDWLHCCEETYAIGHVKPAAYIHCLGESHSKQKLDLLCRDLPGGSDILATQIHNPVFRHVIMVEQSSIVPLREITHAMNEGMDLRASLHIGRSAKQIAGLRAAYIRHLRSRNVNCFLMKPITIAKKSSANRCMVLANALIMTNRHRIGDSGFSDVLASYLGYHCGRRAGLTPSGPYANRFPGHRHSATLRDALARASCLTLEMRNWLTAEVISKWRDWTAKYTKKIPGNNSLTLLSHHDKLKEHAVFLRHQEYGPLCVLCFTNPMVAILECNRHAFCESCISHVVSADKLNCPICSTLPTPREMVRPELHRGRILSLDGGGMKGFLQLEILAMIESDIGLDLPLSQFFDLIVGTSIGGLVALGLGAKGWSIATCQENLARLSRKIFSQRSRLSSGIARMTGGWSVKLSKALRVFWFDSIYNGKLLESVLSEAFGDSDKLQERSVDSTLVAVTATTGSAPPCAIFTNYDKTLHPRQKAYGWPDHEVASKIKIWEAARCTSAAPVYFAKKVLFGTAFHDGGMLHNNPSAIACREGSILWNCPASENLLISVGCGDFQVVNGGENSLARLWNAFSQKLSPAKEEDIRSLWGADGDRPYERLDPRLDMPDIPLDSLHTMLDVLPAAKALMSSCLEFQQQIRKTSWRLIAATFQAESIFVKKLGAQNVVILSVMSRLGKDMERIWNKWPDAHFGAGGRRVRCSRTSGKLSLHISCRQNEHDIDVRLNALDRSSSISGFPLLFSKITDVKNDPQSTLGKRKR